MEFKWDSNFEASAQTPDGEMKSLVIKGTLLDTTVNANNWAIDDSEFDSLVQQIPGSQMRADHSKSIRDIIGAFTKAEHDKVNKKILFEAEIDDLDIIKKILKKRVSHVSPCADAEAFCSICGEKAQPKVCKCENSHLKIKNISFKEGSIISEAAYKNSTFSPLGFAASIGKVLEAVPEKIESKDNKVNNGISTTKKESGNKEKEEKIMSDKKEEVEATQLKPAGGDSVVLLNETVKKLEETLGRFVKKMDDDETYRKKRDEDEAKRKKDEDEAKAKIKKEEDEAKAKLKKEEEEAKAKIKIKKQPEEEEEEEEEEEKKPIKKGAKVDTSEDGNLINDLFGQTEEELKMKAGQEIIAAAKKFGII